MLQHDYLPVIFYSNSNIYPRSEYDTRHAEILRYADKLGVEIISDTYDHDDWLCAMSGYESEPERGARCELCFRYRLGRAALKAYELGIDLFTTTLASSRWKSLDQINAAGTWAENQVCSVLIPDPEVLATATCKPLTFWTKNWRKDGLQDRRNALLRENNFYNQLYCGCEFSMARLKG